MEWSIFNDMFRKRFPFVLISTALFISACNPKHENKATKVPPVNTPNHTTDGTQFIAIVNESPNSYVSLRS